MQRAFRCDFAGLSCNGLSCRGADSLSSSGLSRRRACSLPWSRPSVEADYPLWLRWGCRGGGLSCWGSSLSAGRVFHCGFAGLSSNALDSPVLLTGLRTSMFGRMRRSGLLVEAARVHVSPMSPLGRHAAGFAYGLLFRITFGEFATLLTDPVLLMGWLSRFLSGCMRRSPPLIALLMDCCPGPILAKLALWAGSGEPSRLSVDGAVACSCEERIATSCICRGFSQPPAGVRADRRLCYYRALYVYAS